MCHLLSCCLLAALSFDVYCLRGPLNYSSDSLHAWLPKACGWYLVTYLNHTPMFDWCVVGWGSKYKRHKDTCLKEIGLHLQISSTTSHSMMITIERTCVYNEGINKHILPITITESKEVQASIWSLLTFHHRFANPTQIWRCKSVQ